MKNIQPSPEPLVPANKFLFLMEGEQEHAGEYLVYWINDQLETVPVTFCSYQIALDICNLHNDTHIETINARNRSLPNSERIETDDEVHGG